MIQKNKEKPFFDEFAKRTGLPIDADYKAIDQLGIKDTEQLRVMKAGLFDIVSLRVSQNSRDEPTLLGMDLVGASPDYAAARKVYEAYFDTLDQRLQKQFQVKLLGVWPFGPQILFCKKPHHPADRPEGHEGAGLRPEPGQVHRNGRWHAGAAVVHRGAPVAVAGRGRLRHHRPELGQLVELAGGDHAPVPAGLPDGAERLRHHAEGLEPPEARPAGQDAGRLQDA